jgi:hypothetical protein
VTVNLSQSELRVACTSLFGAPELPGHLEGEWRSAVRSAFRRRVFETHPDRALALGRSEEELRAEFSQVNEAYQLLSSLPPPRVVIQAPRPQRAPAQARPAPQRARPPVTPPRAQPAPRPQQPAGERFHEGPLPDRRLRLGEYLYYSRRISWRTLIEALSWQRRSHQPLGQLALRWGRITEGDLLRLLRRHRLERHLGHKLGELLVREGLLTGFQLQALLGQQQRLRPALGGFFLEHGLCAPHELEAIVAWQQRWARQRGG